MKEADNQKIFGKAGFGPTTSVECSNNELLPSPTDFRDITFHEFVKLNYQLEISEEVENL